MPPARRRRGEEDEEPKETSRWLYIFFLLLFCGSGLPVILPVIDMALDWLGSKGYTVYGVEDAALPQVFFGGDPWVIFCRKEGQEIPGLWSAAAKKHVQSEDIGMFSMGVLDCSAPFAKSGKSTYDRFKLKAPEFSHAILCANGAPPSMLPWDWAINDPKQPEIQAVLTQIKTKTKPISRVVSTTTSLSDYCTSTKRCALILHNATLEDAAKSVLESLMLNYRLVKWVRVDIATRYLSLEKSLPPLPDAPANEPRLVFFKRDPDAKTRVLAAKAHKGLFTVSEVSAFLDDCLNTTGEGSPMAALKHTPYITKRSAIKDAESKPKEASKPKPKKEAPKKANKEPSEQEKEDREARKRASKEKSERARQAREERESQQEEEETTNTAEEEEMGEETIDLDDVVKQEL